ncbi:hypothetical protein PG988_006195 [Apiospora saccharicola]
MVSGRKAQAKNSTEIEHGDQSEQTTHGIGAMVAVLIGIAGVAVGWWFGRKSLRAQLAANKDAESGRRRDQTYLRTPSFPPSPKSAADDETPSHLIISLSLYISLMVYL